MALGFGFSAYGAWQSSQVDSLTIGAPALEQSALLYVAEGRHFFADNDLDVTIRDYDTGVASMKALLAGEIDIAEMAEFPFLRPVLEGQPLRILAVNDRFENDYLLVRTDRGISTIADLRGKTIGLIRGTVLEFLVGRLLALNGVGLEEVTIVDTGTVARTIQAIAGGEVDAVVAFQPHVHTIQTQMGGGVTTWPVQNNQLVYGVLVADATWIEAHFDVTQRFLLALVQAEHYVATHPAEARAIVQDRLGLTDEYLAANWPLHQFTLLLDFSLVAAMNDEARWMIDSGLVSQQAVPDLADYVYFYGLQAIKPEAVSINR